MTIYGLGGLGADERVFNFLKLDHPIVPLKWKKPRNKEILRDYVVRLSYDINQSEEFALIGLSFGGMVAIELSKIVNPKKTILISSVARKQELPFLFRNKFINLLHFLIPEKGLAPPSYITNWFFSIHNPEHKAFLFDIIDKTDKQFMRWAFREITHWQNDQLPKNLIRIHGTNDRLLPRYKGGPCYDLPGGHGIIMEKPEKVSEIINEILANKETSPE